jgi:hypothetical protein
MHLPERVRERERVEALEDEIENSVVFMAHCRHGDAVSGH